MRSTSIITISVPPKLAAQVQNFIKTRSMTRSEFLRAAMREYLAKEDELLQAIRLAREEYKTGKTKILSPSGLAKLISR